MPIERLLDKTGFSGHPDDLYLGLQFPDSPPGRPYTYVNMVSTVDGKILIGPRGSTAKGVGGPTDQLLLRRLEDCCDCAIIGAGTLRPGNVIYPPGIWRAVVTRSGRLPLDNRFFRDAPDRAIVFAPENLHPARHAEVRKHAKLYLTGVDSVDVSAAARILHESHHCRTLLLEGGADLNDEFFRSELVDELFITIAPKIKGGNDRPSPVDGLGFPGREFARLELLSAYCDESEVYLRYRVGRTETA
jgi:riboflavin biosynthesis pyrimidine reductase